MMRGYRSQPHGTVGALQALSRVFSSSHGRVLHGRHTHDIYELMERNDILAMALLVPRERNDLPDAASHATSAAEAVLAVAAAAGARGMRGGRQHLA